MHTQPDVSELIEELDLPHFQCKFYVYLMPSISCSIGETRLHVAIEYSVIYDEVYYLPFMEIGYTEEEYKRCCCDKEQLTKNLTAHFLTSHLLSRDLNEYFH